MKKLILTACVFALLSNIGYSQFEDLIKGLTGNLEKNITKAVIGSVVGEIQINNPIAGRKTSLNTLTNDLLSSAGYNYSGSSVLDKLEKIFTWDVMKDVQVFRRNGQAVSIADLAYSYGYSQLLSNYYVCKEAFLNGNNEAFSAAVTMLMANLDAVTD